MADDNNDDLLLIIGKRIEKQRKLKKLSRESLAEMADMSSRSLASIILGEQEMKITTAIHLCQALDISPNYLLFEKRDWQTNELAELVQNCPPSKMEYVIAIIQNCLKM